jgi:hypothetical protein
MLRALPSLFDVRKGVFFLAVDSKGPIRGVNSDNLRMLSYLEPGDLPKEVVESIVRASEVIETEWG